MDSSHAAIVILRSFVLLLWGKKDKQKPTAMIVAFINFTFNIPLMEETLKNLWFSQIFQCVQKSAQVIGVLENENACMFPL